MLVNPALVIEEDDKQTEAPAGGGGGKHPVWTWPHKRSLLQRLRSSEYHRMRAGEIARPPNRFPAAGIRHKTCQWIAGDPRAEDGPLFCGDPVQPGRSYCPAHCDRAFERVEGEEDDAP